MFAFFLDRVDKREWSGGCEVVLADFWRTGTPRSRRW
jgi:hypothetical protein